RLAEDVGTGADEEEEQEKTRRRRSGRNNVSSDAAQTQVEDGEDLEIGDELLQTADATEEEVVSDIVETLDTRTYGDKEGDEEESGDEALRGRKSGQKNK
ncbi:hypothetical protein HK104_002504, partial [Borealophlyctis nickersoniae]